MRIAELTVCIIEFHMIWESASCKQSSILAHLSAARWVLEILHNLRKGLAPSQARRFLATRWTLRPKKNVPQEVAAAQAQFAFND